MSGGDIHNRGGGGAGGDQGEVCTLNTVGVLCYTLQMEFSVTGRLIPRHDIKVGDALVTGTPTTRLKQSPFPIFRMVIRDS